MLRARTEEAKDERRQIILSAALDEFFEKGFAAARMDDIAKRAKLSKAAIYLYFDNKDALFGALIENVTSAKIAGLQAIFSSDLPFEPTIRRLSEFLPQIVMNSDLPRLLKVMIGESQTFSPLITSYRTQVLERIISAFTGFLGACRDRGEIEFEDARLTAQLIMAPVALNGVWKILFDNDPDAAIDIPKMFRLHADNIIRALRKPGAANAT